MRARRAFSLVELLVVLAIISVLAAIMLPALMSARKSAYKVVCMSNLRQAGMSLRMQMDNCDGDCLAVLTAGISGSCPLDSQGDWANRFNREVRGIDVPNTVRNSYLSGYGPNNEGTARQWYDDGTYAVAVCQMHGERIIQTPAGPYYGAYEGLILRLNPDCSVVRRHVHWPRCAKGIGAPVDWLFTDAATPAGQDPCEGLR
jgi:prepilin-type N-terminal cleavage/methylation domain-containing protein